MSETRRGFLGLFGLGAALGAASIVKLPSEVETAESEEPSFDPYWTQERLIWADCSICIAELPTTPFLEKISKG